ncbi:MAG: universal stress protein [Nitrospirota bacterium]|nr:universal stress protein [Nitrospirota bacterium]MDP2383090.1 universal stress protein [Nitrospirota bacterium]MDP3596540.1 universal stress protein [Nitrospirota bacterium]
MLSFRQIFHPTDFSAAESSAFAHALKLTCLVQGELTMMHVDPTVGRKDFEDFPRIRPLLARWGVLPEGSSKSDVVNLGIQIKRVRAVADHATDAILQQLMAHPSDLLVLSTHQRDGFARLTHKAVAEPLSRKTQTKTLFVPTGVEGFVSTETGKINLTRVLIPIVHTPHPQPAIDLAAELASALGSEKVLFELVHLGKEDDLPKFTKPERPGWSWETLAAKGDPVEWILAAGAEFDVDLIVMMTEGHNSLFDLLRGSTTERVVRGARCPLLAIPA